MIPPAAYAAIGLCFLASNIALDLQQVTLLKFTGHGKFTASMKDIQMLLPESFKKTETCIFLRLVEFYRLGSDRLKYWGIC